MTISTADGSIRVQPQDARHLLDPLTEGRLPQTTRVLQASGHLTPRMRIMAYSLHEPDKGQCAGFSAGQALPRAWTCHP